MYGSIPTQKVAIVYFNGTFVKLLNGAHVRVTQLIHFLNRHCERVVIYSYRDHPTCPWGKDEINLFHREHLGVELVLETTSRLQRIWTRSKFLAAMIAPKLFWHMSRYMLPRITPAFSELKSKYPDALYVVNYAKGFSELNGVPKAEILVETHDLEFLNAMKQQLRKISDLKTWIQARGEINQLLLASRIISIAPLESAFYKLTLPEKCVYYIPAYETGADYPETPTGTIRYDMLFVGSENLLNVRGISNFMQSNANWLSGKRLAIAGKVCQANEVIAIAHKVGAYVLNFVEDLKTLYQESKLVISPVEGTGMKIKVLEALTTGKPVFGSRHTLDGLPAGYEDCVFPLSLSEIDTLLKDDAALAAASASAKSYISRITISGDLGELARYVSEPSFRPE